MNTKLKHHTSVLSRVHPAAALAVLMLVLAAPVALGGIFTTNWTTVGTFSWTPPTGVTSITVAVLGAGGGGGGGSANATTPTVGSGGGGGGCAYVSTLAVSPSTTYTVVVGAGGVGTGTASSGGASSFSGADITTVTGFGGGKGTNSSTSTLGGAGGGGSGPAGVIVYTGGNGGTANVITTGTPWTGGYSGGGGGGAGTTGNGAIAPGQTAGGGGTGSPSGGSGGAGKNQGSNSNGSNGTAPGGGGSGGAAGTGASKSGGTGGAGQVILTWPPASPSVISYGNVGPFTYNGTAQGPTVSFTGSTGATTTNYVGVSLSYNSVNAPTNAGSYYVSNTVAADVNFFGATNSQTFVINKATATLAVINSPTSYDGNPHAAVVVVVGNSPAGLVTNVLTGGAASQTALGVYPVTADFVPNDTNNYTALTGVNVGNFEIAGTSVIRYGNVGPFTYDGSAHGPAITFTGSTGATTTNYVGVSASYNSVNPPTNPGTYYLSNTVAADANYEGTTNSQSFTINPAPLTIQANNVFKLYGQTLTFAGTEFTTLNPLYGGDAVTSVTLTSAGTTASAPTGPYPIVPSAAVGSGLSNYSITYNNGTLAVTNLPVLYVSPNGSGTNFTLAQPGALVNARNYLRAMGTNQTSDITVYLLGGTYPLTNSFQLQENATNHDSGQNGYNIVYMNYPGQTPVISGGMTVTNWTLFDSTTNIWRAFVGTGVNSRQLFVNGVRAIRARSAISPSGFQLDTNTGNGFWTQNLSMQNWRNITNIEIATRQNWKMLRCPIASITGTNITMQQPGWSVIGTTPKPGHPWNGAGSVSMKSVSWVENAYELMASPGMWYLDQAAGWLYYIPRPGENLTNGASVVLPVLEKLVDAQGGSVTTPLHNVIFSGLTFQYATWLLPSTSMGYADNQTGIMWPSNGVGAVKTPGHVSFQTTANIQITNCVFTHLGGSALDFGGGVHNNLIIGNRLDDFSACGITVGEVTDYATADPNQMTDGNTVQDNFIRRPGLEYEDCIGIWFGYSRNTTVAHNDIDNAPYTGMSVGWGWGTASYSVNNQVLNNYVGRVMAVLIDGGCCYTLSAQTNSWMIGNYFTDSGAHGIYWDEGTSFYTATSNVLANCSGNYLNFHIVSGTGDVGTNNFANGNKFNPAPPNGIVTNTVITTNQFWTPDGQQIILNAGLEPAFAWLKSEYFVNDDEPAFDVVPSDWKAGANAGEYSKDNHYTKIDGQAVQYSFTAAGITWIGEMNVDESNVDVYLDGNYQQTVNCWSSTRVTQARMFSATNLAAGPHTLKLVKRGGTYMIVDALAVTPTNFWLTSTPNSGSVTPSITFSNMIKLDTFGGYTDTTTLSAVTLPFGLPLPAGMTANFNPPTLTGAGFSVLTITASNNTPAGNYELAITGTGGGVTNLVAVNLTVSGTSVQAPIITSQPASLTNYPGTLATFAVVATGSPASYQWRKNGANLADGGNVSGSTGAILNLGNVSSNDAANYSVILNNSAGSVTSSVVTLTVTGNAPSAPVANFTVSPTNGIRPLAVTFIDTSAGSITNLLWNFGDSQTTNTAAGAVVAHTYKTNGTYTVSLVASGSGGSSTNTQLNSVTVLVPNPPHISGISSFSGNALVLQGSGGPTNGGYYYWLRSSTNITLPLANWNVVATNPFDVYGNFSNQIPLMPGTPQTFYRLQMP